MDSQKDFDGVKVFTATMAAARAGLGDKVGAWMKDHPAANVVDTVVTQSSDESFHCLTITLFYRESRDHLPAACALCSARPSSWWRACGRATA